MAVQPSGSGMSRLPAYHGRSRSRKTTSCPFAASSRTRPRQVVAWPLPHDEVIDSPRMTMFTAGGLSSFPNLGDLPRAMRVRVLREDAFQRGAADAARAIGVERAHELRDFGAIARYEHFFVRLEKEIDAFPRIGDEARAGAGRFENARGGRPAVRGHALAADVQHRARRAVERVVIAGEDVADVRDRGRHRLVVPSRAAEEKAAVGKERGGAQEKLFNARLAIGKPITEEGEIGVEFLL